ncbi:m7GpppN-mRNA hydrolase-like [Artemia franciscana]|uniref:Nudix hydrolase domain-containing protein n=1 Tax=Artemia franciscana TaxID=6661 RepID=A0AA88IGL9_ARTSF|nr:hypothetical protein QYM36_004373 [Artemia franciscana]
MSNENFNHLLEKYILSLPKEETKNLNKVCNQIQLVNWALYDSPNKEDDSPYMTSLRKLKYKEFMHYIFDKVEFLRKDISNIATIYSKWQKYCRLIPTYGCILVNSTYDKVLLVKVFGSKYEWSFPKGKIEENENEVDCAVREVFEETGYRCNMRCFDSNRYIERGKRDGHSRYCKLFIIYDVNEETNFKQKSTYEIIDIKWHSISEIFDKINTRKYRLVRPYMFKLLSNLSQKAIDRIYKIKYELNATYFGSQVFYSPMAYNYGSNQVFRPHSVTFIVHCPRAKDYVLIRISSLDTRLALKFFTLPWPIIMAVIRFFHLN